MKKQRYTIPPSVLLFTKTPNSIGVLVKEKMKRDKKVTTFKPAKLYDAGGNMRQPWYIEYYCHNPAINKLQRVRQKFGLNRIKTKLDRYAEAKQICIYVNEILGEGFNPFIETSSASSKKTIASAFNEQKEHIKARYKKRTAETYTHSLLNFQLFLNKSFPQLQYIHEITGKTIRTYRDYLQTERKIKNTTTNNYISFLKIVFTDLVSRGFTKLNPCIEVKEFKTESGSGRVYFTDDEMLSIEKQLKATNKNLWLYARLIYYCYLRPNEIQELKPDNFDFKRWQVNIYAGDSKSGRRDSIIIPKPIRKELQQYVLKVKENHYLFTDRNKLIPGTIRLERNRVSELWNRLVKQTTGIKKDMYAFKHSGAIAAVKAGIPITDIQRQLRHTSLETTQQYLQSMTVDLNSPIATRFPSIT